MVFSRLLRSSPAAEAAHRLYGAILRQARLPAFHASLDVPDTLDGRFDLLLLHAFLVLRRLKREGKDARTLAERLLDVLLDDLDRTLREMGVADLAVGRQVKAMARGLYGRIAAYEEGLAGPAGVLEGALRRNLYGTTRVGPDRLALLAGYVRGQAANLDRQPVERLAAGRIDFVGPPAPRAAASVRARPIG